MEPDFDAALTEAIAQLPDRYQAMLEGDITLLVEDEAEPSDRSAECVMNMGVIMVYRKVIERGLGACTQERAVRLIADILRHELAHATGIHNHAVMPRTVWPIEDQTHA